DALTRLDLILDGGVRDLFNFVVAANHVGGAIAARTRADGSPIKHTVFYDGYDWMPGQQPGAPQNAVPQNILWADIPDVPVVRYGTVDATPAMIQQGDGQHVGTAL